MATHRHILIAASYESDRAIPSMEITRIVRSGLSDLDVEVEQIMSYTQSYRMSPMAAGLVEAWQNLTDLERNCLPEPIRTAIMVMLGVVTVPDPKPAKLYGPPAGPDRFA